MENGKCESENFDEKDIVEAMWCALLKERHAKVASIRQHASTYVSMLICGAFVCYPSLDPRVA